MLNAKKTLLTLLCLSLITVSVTVFAAEDDPEKEKICQESIEAAKATKRLSRHPK